MRIAGDNGEPLEGEQFWVARKKEIVNIKFDVLKNRHGQESSFVLVFNKAFQIFDSFEARYDKHKLVRKSSKNSANKGSNGIKDVDDDQYPNPWIL
jgi:hypothetical protein